MRYISTPSRTVEDELVIRIGAEIKDVVTNVIESLNISSFILVNFEK